MSRLNKRQAHLSRPRFEFGGVFLCVGRKRLHRCLSEAAAIQAETAHTTTSGSKKPLNSMDAFTESKKDDNYKDVGFVTPPENGYVNAFGYSEEFDWLFLPSEVNHGANSSIPVGDADIENGGKMLDDLQESLILHTYHTSPYTRKQRKEGNKIRDLYKLPYYPDRIAQWAVIQVIEPILIKNLITDTYSAIPKRGIHPGLERLKGWMDSDIVGTQYCLKIDARHYYQSINHELLKDKFRRLFKDADLIWFMRMR